MGLNMAKDSYIYAVARIRTHETKLLNHQFMEQLIAAPDEDAAMKLLVEHGWGAPEMSAEQMLDREKKKTWELIRELVPDNIDIFDVFLYQSDYHNLKAAIKECCTSDIHDGIYEEDGITIDPKEIEKAVAARDFKALPERMQEPAARAMETLFKTRDGQLCDIIIDRAALDAIREAGKATGSRLLALYGEYVAAMSDVKICARAVRTGKDRTFLGNALADCEHLDVSSLADSASQGEESFKTYLGSTGFSAVVDMLSKSPSAFECACDSYLIEQIQPQLHNSFGIDPLAAYILARRMEIKSVRIILTGKRNDLPDESIRGRVRETYV